MIKFTINISGEELPVSVEQHRRFRRCSMRVNDSGLRITVPLSYQEHEWREFIDKNRRWIYRTYSKHKTRKRRLPELKEGEKIPFRGNFYTCTGSDVEEVMFTDDKLLVPAPLLQVEQQEELQNKLLAIYLAAADELLSSLIKKWHPHLADNIKNIKLKEMRSRWGSCSSKGTIAMNWRLIMAPDEVFEYVFVHELCHIEIKAHNNSFWHSVEHHFPGATIWRRLLKKNNYMLMNFPFPVSAPRTLITKEIN